MRTIVVVFNRKRPDHKSLYLVPNPAEDTTSWHMPVVLSDRRRWLLILLGLPALFPILCMLPAILTGNGNDIGNSTADVLGTGSELLLFITLAITPIVTITGARWVVPLRKWYGIMTGINAVTDGVLASITTQFPNGPEGRIAGHIFVLVGATMAAILIPLVLTSNNWSMRKMGKYWKYLQRFTYAVWFLLGVHLLLLFNAGPHSGGPISHQRFYQFLACSIPLLFFRLPPVRRWIITERKTGGWQSGVVSGVMVTAFVISFAFILNEEIFKGLAALVLNPINN